MGRAVVEGFAGFTNTKGVPSSRNAPPSHGARPSLGHIWYEDEQIWVKDKGSSNGTFVNGMKVTGEQVSS